MFAIAFHNLILLIHIRGKVYAFFQWCDRFSLILCNRELPAGQRAL